MWKFDLFMNWQNHLPSFHPNVAYIKVSCLHQAELIVSQPTAATAAERQNGKISNMSRSR